MGDSLPIGEHAAGAADSAAALADDADGIPVAFAAARLAATVSVTADELDLCWILVSG
jgi:hypothetical protein